MKECPICKKMIEDEETHCYNCNHEFENDNENSSEVSKGYGWLYFCIFLMPLIGIILGSCYMANKNEEMGKKILTYTVAILVLIVALIYVFYYFIIKDTI